MFWVQENKVLYCRREEKIRKKKWVKELPVSAMREKWAMGQSWFSQAKTAGKGDRAGRVWNLTQEGVRKVSSVKHFYTPLVIHKGRGQSMTQRDKDARSPFYSLRGR